MNFLPYLLSLFLFYLGYWYLISLITCLPGVGAVSWFIIWFIEEKVPPASKIGRILGTILVHFASMVLNTFVIGVLVALITTQFAEKSTFPWLYLVVGGEEWRE